MKVAMRLILNASVTAAALACMTPTASGQSEHALPVPAPLPAASDPRPVALGTIRRMIQAAKAGETVLVPAGTYA